MLGCCGADCEICPRYLATRKGEIEIFEKVAEMWHKVGWTKELLPPEKLLCNGCDSREDCRYSELRECVREKKLSNCGECKKYPCKAVFDVFERSTADALSSIDSFSKPDYQLLKKAFFSKKEKLDEINKNKD